MKLLLRSWIQILTPQPVRIQLPYGMGVQDDLAHLPLFRQGKGHQIGAASVLPCPVQGIGACEQRPHDRSNRWIRLEKRIHTVSLNLEGDPERSKGTGKPQVYNCCKWFLRQIAIHSM